MTSQLLLSLPLPIRFGTPPQLRTNPPNKKENKLTPTETKSKNYGESLQN